MKAGVVAGLQMETYEDSQTAPAGIVSHEPFQTGNYSQKPNLLGGARTPRQFRTLQIRAIVTHRTRSVGSKDQAIRDEADRGLGHRVRVYYAKKEKK